MIKTCFKIINLKGFCAFLSLLLNVSVGNAQWPVFQDVTESKGFVDIPLSSFIYGNGAAVADYDGDGDLDFFIGTDTGISDRLYLNDGNGGFTDIAASVGIGSNNRTRTAIWADYDGDKDLDLITLGDCYGDTCNDPIKIYLFQQQDNGSFIEVASTIGLDFQDKYDTVIDIAIGGLAAGDLNEDGFLDLIISVWGGSITYFENSGSGTFIDKSTNSLIGPDFQYRWQPMLYDFNGDGYLDIYCNVDYVDNELWVNNGDGTFTDNASLVSADSAYNEMGLSLSDYDNDGDMDIYATNISRVDNSELRHNILLKNNTSETGDLGFSEIANPLQIGASGWDWGTTFFDANNDGKQDLAVTNGWTPDNWGLDASRLWLNLGDGLFGDISSSAQFDDTYDATTLLAFDMDRDGDLDLLQTLKDNLSVSTPLRLYENQLNTTSAPGNYIVIKPRMNIGANYFSIGAIVKITIDDTTQMQLITAGTSFYGQEPAEAFFGVNDATTIDELRIEWPDNTITLLQNIDVNQVLTVANTNVLNTENFQSSNINIYPNPFSSILKINANQKIEKVSVYSLLGKQVFQKKKLNDNQVSINLSELKSGFYLIKTTYLDGTKSQFSKILKN